MDERSASDGAQEAGSSETGRHPETIGAYRILGKLGAGGMGIVFEAEQPHPRRTVALKVIRGGRLFDERTTRSFQREIDTLARLEHPNIAAIYDSGHTEDGQQYFAMELVRGVPLDEHLAARHEEATLARELRYRLELFREIADAVHHAHQCGVIHRDLKPSNLMVTEKRASSDSSSSQLGLPAIKVLDFGLARIVEDDELAGANSLSTEVGVIKGTLPYMSPEQARGDSRRIDTRSDVYSLGVILHEMLTGRRPQELEHVSVVEALRLITDVPAPALNACASTRRFDRDLETIVGRALEKDPNRRYSSAAALSEDVHRFLASQPILARAPSAAYQLRKLVARNRLASAFVATLFVTLVGFGAWMSVLYRDLGVQFQVTKAAEQDLEEQLRLTQSAETLAREESTTAREVARFLIDLFETADPSRSRGKTITVREMLSLGARRIQDELQAEPAIRARLLGTISRGYAGLGSYAEAEQIAKQAWEAARDSLAPYDDVYGDSFHVYAAALSRSSKYAECVRFIEEHWDELGDADERLDIVNVLAVGYMRIGELDRAEPLLRDLLDSHDRSGREDMQSTLVWRSNLAMILRDGGRYEESRPEQERAYQGLSKLLGEDAPMTLAALDGLSQDHAYLGEFEQAERLFQRALATRERVLGRQHPETLVSVNNLAYAYGMQGKFEQAEPLQLEVLEWREKTFGSSHPATCGAMANLARTYAARDRIEEGLELTLAARDGAAETLGADHPSTVAYGVQLIRMEVAAGERQAARGHADELLAILATDHPARAEIEAAVEEE